jgi:hypothetical protein
MFLLLCVLCEMVGVTHNYYYYSILKRHERDRLKNLLLSLNYTTTIHTLCIEHMYMKLRFQQYQFLNYVISITLFPSQNIKYR